ncbi:hypothetical protein Clacol_005601 [Clathrus columnatus]|uniref:VPS9 domain-containing protein n=1 Tax=Clathrus columnatus TaxID=1419009 RepID=A0AAV5A9T8_9AGAM|nr:hypothetical protein Clacol_005601 [Clathrus columnatus]
MSTTRDSLSISPSGSISKAGGQLRRTPSRDSLNAHPLLANTPALHLTNSSSSLKSEVAPKYVPYTPRHRPPTSSATTGTSNQPASSLPTHQAAGHANATSMLHTQNLKATAQSISIGIGTVGWAILEKLTDGESGAEWDEIWNVLITVKPILLLPLEPYSGEAITPDFVKDHIAFWGNLNPSFVTYSGLRGTLESGTLTFQSSLDTNSPMFSSLLKPDHLNSILSSLPPLPILKNNLHHLPAFTLPAHANLQIYPRPIKPPLPPRPSASAPTSKPYGSRIANPFASLFGRPSSSLPSNRPSSPSPSISSFTDEASNQHISYIEIRAYSLGKKIVKSSVLSDLSKIYKSEIKARLGRCPQWVKNRVYGFAMPFVQQKDSPTSRRSSRASGSVPSLTLSMDGNALSDAFQTLYVTIRDDILRQTVYSDEGSEDTSFIGSDTDVDDEKIIPILDEVETALCEIFYDRLFCPIGGDDLSHDDTLANRIAGLNMLDLGLEHLGVDIPNKQVEESALEVVRTCGAILQKLEDAEYHSPAKKASLLVEAHKSVVDGLSRLPKLRLRPEGEDADLKPPPLNLERKNVSTSGSLTPPQMVVTEPIDPKEQGKRVSENESDDHTNSSDIIHDTTEQEDGSDIPKVSTTTSVSGDILFPFLIYSVVKANPPHLVSHILFTERFRAPSAKGEEKYCLINLMAVVEFLEHVDMGALGLGDSDRIMSTGDLSPITLTHNPADPTLTKILSKRVNQQVGELAELAGSAGKMVTGVVDTSFGMLRGFLGNQPDSIPQIDTTEITPWNMVKPSFGLLRRVSLGRPKTPSGCLEEEGRQLVEVSSRPGSIRGLDTSDDDNEAEEVSDDEKDEGQPETDNRDTRSIKSFSSMMSKESRGERATLADRLAKMSANAKLREAKPSPPASRPVSMTSGENTISQAPIPKSKIPPPNQRFMECNEQDLRISEVAELLREYRRVVQGMRNADLFEEHT